MIAHLLRLPPRLQDNVVAVLEAIPSKARNNSLHKWRKLLGILCRITLTIAGLRGMFTQV